MRFFCCWRIRIPFWFYYYDFNAALTQTHALSVTTKTTQTVHRYPWLVHFIDSFRLHLSVVITCAVVFRCSFFFFSMSILWESLVLASTSATLHTKIMWFVSLEEGEFWIFGILFLSCFNVKHLIIWSKQRIVVYVSIGWKFESFIIQFWSKMELNGTLSICAQTHSAYTLTRIDQNL